MNLTPAESLELRRDCANLLLESHHGRAREIARELLPEGSEPRETPAADLRQNSEEQGSGESEAANDRPLHAGQREPTRQVKPLSKDDLLSLGKIGARNILRGGLVYADWAAKVRAEIPDILDYVSEESGLEPAEVLRQVHRYAAAGAKRFGANPEPTPARGTEEGQTQAKGTGTVKPEESSDAAEGARGSGETRGQPERPRQNDSKGAAEAAPLPLRL